MINSELLSFFFNLFIYCVRLIKIKNKKKLNYNSVPSWRLWKIVIRKKNQIRLFLMFSYETNQQHNNVHESSLDKEAIEIRGKGHLATSPKTYGLNEVQKIHQGKQFVGSDPFCFIKLSCLLFLWLGPSVRFATKWHRFWPFHEDPYSSMFWEMWQVHFFCAVQCMM